jgi:delta14-sterol reductase
MCRYAVYGVVSIPMGLYLLFTWWYTIDYLWVEHKICTTWDIIAEHFGFGLVVRRPHPPPTTHHHHTHQSCAVRSCHLTCVCRATYVQWGDHAFYPFFYSIQAHYLIEPFELHPVAYLAIVAVFFTGYTIFRQCVSLSIFFSFSFIISHDTCMRYTGRTTRRTSSSASGRRPRSGASP